MLYTCKYKGIHYIYMYIDTVKVSDAKALIEAVISIISLFGDLSVKEVTYLTWDEVKFLPNDDISVELKTKRYKKKVAHKFIIPEKGILKKDGSTFAGMILDYKFKLHMTGVNSTGRVLHRAVSEVQYGSQNMGLDAVRKMIKGLRKRFCMCIYVCI